MMTRTISYLSSLFAATALYGTPAFALEITLPAETAAYKPSNLPGYQQAL